MTILRPIITFLKHLRRISYQDPTRDWLLLITLSLIALAGIIVWDVWAFDTVSGGGVIGAPVTKTSPVFDSSVLDAVHTLFESRAAEETKYITGTVRFIDPSQ